MRLRGSSFDRGYWKQIHENIILYNKDIYSTKYPLTIKNIQQSIEIEQNDYTPFNIVLISKLFNQLYIVKGTRRFSQFAKLEIDTLKLKKIHKIFQEYLFFSNPIFYEHHRIFYFIEGKGVVITHKNKLIQKLNCDISKILPEQLLMKMTIKYFNSFRQFSIESVINKIQTNFEKLLNIQKSQINQKYGNYIFKRVGDFIILKHQKSFILKAYYIQASILNEMPGQYGFLELEENEKVKLMKVFHNQLYILTITLQSINLFRIQDKQRVLIYQKKYECKCRTLKNPTFNQKYLVLTHRYYPASEPEIIKLDLEQQ